MRVREKRYFNRGNIAIAAFVTIVTVYLPMTLVHADDNITVTCYSGPDEGSNLGSLLTFAPETAGQICNKIFYACKGKCYGCYSDFDLGDDVCYDNAGRRFLK